jgi:hypothetical protein
MQKTLKKNHKNVVLGNQHIRLISFLLEKEIAEFKPVDYNSAVYDYLKHLKDVKIIIDWYL